MSVIRTMNLLQVTVFLGAVLSVRGLDPTAVCFPPTFQTTYSNVITGDKGTVYVDFAKELWVEVSSVTGVRTVNDFINLKTYVITGQGNDTVCHSFKLSPSHIMYKCLPPFAKEARQESGYVAYDTSFIYTFDIPTEYDTIYRVFLSYVSGNPFMPIMSQQFGYHGTTDMFIYINSSTTISNVSLFSLPPDCETQVVNLSTIVG